MAKEDKDLPVYLIYGNKYGFPEKHQEVRLTKRYIDRLHAYYETELDLADSRLAYIFRIEEDGKSFYFSEDGITETYDFSAAYYDFFQMPYINQADVHRSLDWTKSAVFYQIFVDRFYNGHEDGRVEHAPHGSVLHAHWDNNPVYVRDMKNGHILAYDFFGGNLAVVLAKLH